MQKCHLFCVGVHQKFKSFLSDSYEHGGEAFSLQYGTGQLLGIAGKDTLQVSLHLKQGVSLQVNDFQGSSDTGLALEDLVWFKQGQGEVPPSCVLRGVGAAPALGCPDKSLRFYFAFLLVSLGFILGL